MTISATEVAAVVGDVDVDVEAGSLTLDAGQAPHVQGEITTPLSAAVLAAVDPRSTVAPRVTITPRSLTTPRRTSGRGPSATSSTTCSAPRSPVPLSPPRRVSTRT